MKAIILAAGRGTRLNKYTRDLPKGMLKVCGKPIIQHQIGLYNKYGVDEISIVTGYEANKIQFKNIKYFHNEFFATTNMVESLFCAEEVLHGEVIISYADIVFDNTILNRVLKFNEAIGVVADNNWKEYWLKRYDKINFDTESLVINSQNQIIELGTENPPLEKIDGRYVGIIKVNSEGCNLIKDHYYKIKSLWRKNHSADLGNFEQMYMTDFLQSMIKHGKIINTIPINNGWVEFDTNEDYERYIKHPEHFKLNLLDD